MAHVALAVTTGSTTTAYAEIAQSLRQLQGMNGLQCLAFTLQACAQAQAM